MNLGNGAPGGHREDGMAAEVGGEGSVVAGGGGGEPSRGGDPARGGEESRSPEPRQEEAAFRPHSLCKSAGLRPCTGRGDGRPVRLSAGPLEAQGARGRKDTVCMRGLQPPLGLRCRRAEHARRGGLVFKQTYHPSIHSRRHGGRAHGLSALTPAPKRLSVHPQRPPRVLGEKGKALPSGRAQRAAN